MFTCTLQPHFRRSPVGSPVSNFYTLARLKITEGNVSLAPKLRLLVGFELRPVVDLEFKPVAVLVMDDNEALFRVDRRNCPRYGTRNGKRGWGPLN